MEGNISLEEYSENEDYLGEMSEGEMSEGEMSEGEMSEGEMSEGEMSEEGEIELYDEEESLSNYQDLLSEMISTNTISQEEYDREMFKTRYYIDVKTKTHILDEDEQRIVNNINEKKKLLSDDYKKGDVSEEDFNKKYLELLRQEYNILKQTEIREKYSKKPVKIDSSLEEKLLKLEKQEQSYNKKIAKKHGITIPSLPRNIKKDELTEYYNKKITGEITNDNFSPEMDDYIKKMEKSKKLIDYHTDSYEITTSINDQSKSGYKYKKIVPVNTKLKMDIKRNKGYNNLLSPDEQLFSERIDNLKDKLRQLSRDDLIDCAGVIPYKYMTYIERLKENKQNVFMFNSNPVDYDSLKKILNEDNAKYYKIDKNLFSDYKYIRPSLDELDNTEIYQEKGSMSYLALKKGINKKDIGEGLDNYVTIKPMPDELYKELTTNSGDKTEIAQAWELRVSLTGEGKKNIVKRFISFEDYLEELKNILLENSKRLRGDSKDILISKIMKISSYLKNKQDPDIYLYDNSQVPLKELLRKKTEINEMKKRGEYKLQDFITIYYPMSQVLVEKLSEDIFNYASNNYEFMIDKIIFIFKNFQETFNNFVERNISILSLINYETPEVLPEDDIDLNDKEKCIKTLLEWRPKTDYYEKYSDELEDTNHDFETFKINHSEISILEISEMMKQYTEKKQWEDTLKKYEKLEVPDGYIEVNYRLRFLLKNRNRLPSRRIYTVAKIKERVENEINLRRLFKSCDVIKYSDLSFFTENIIFNISKSPTQYNEHIKTITNEYKGFCIFLGKFEMWKTGEEMEKYKNVEPVMLSNVVTEFIITEGKIESMDIGRLNKLIEMSGDDLKRYIYSLRGDEIDSYYIPPESDKKANIYRKAIKIMKSAKFEENMKKIKNDIYNEYKPPIVSDYKPTGKVDYIRIEGKYIHGGFYPQFYMYSQDGEIIRENYTRKDLEQLAQLFNLDIQDDSFELYKYIMNFIEDYNKLDLKVEKEKFIPNDNNDYYEYLKTPIKTISYTLRPRLGVEEPGETFSVIKDPVKKYAVPFSYNEDTIPIYNSKLKNLVDNSYIILEGPAIFEDRGEYDFTISEYYIIVEYLNERGKKIKFREGISYKKIIKRSVDNFDSCSRFLNKQSCDNENSYSLEMEGLRLKCKWIEEKCKGVVIEDDELKNFQIKDFPFKNANKNILWKKAVEDSMRHIESLLKIKDLTKDEITILKKEQKSRLYRYYKKLSVETPKFRINVDTVQEEATEWIMSGYEPLQKDKKVIDKKTLVGDYIELTIYKEEFVNYSVPVRIIINKEYKINEQYVIPKQINEDNTVSCIIKDTDDILILNKSDFRKMGQELKKKTTSVFCYIHKDNYEFLKNHRSYYWRLKTIEYISDMGVYKKEKIENKQFIPLNFIQPSGELNGKLLITLNDIYEAMNRTAYNILVTEDNLIYNIIEKINADSQAIDFSIKHNIDLLKLQEKILGRITIFNVIEEYEKTVPRIVLTLKQVTKNIKEGMENGDIDLVYKNYTKAKLTPGFDQELLDEAKKFIKENPKKKVEKEEKSLEKAENIKQYKLSNNNLYASSRRR